MYVPGSREAATVQVKTKRTSSPVGGKGKLLLGYTFPDDCPAQWLAFVDLSRDAARLLAIDKARELAQQKHPNANRLLYWYTDESIGPKKLRESDMTAHKLEAVTTTLIKAN